MKKFTQQQWVTLLVVLAGIGVLGGAMGGRLLRGAPARVDREVRMVNLIGVDADASGVRDDVESSIRDSYDGQLVLAARSYARALGSRMLSLSEGEAARAEQDFEVSQACLKEVLPVGWQVIAATIHDQVVNTRERSEAMSGYFQMLSGYSVTTPPVKPDCAALS